MSNLYESNLEAMKKLRRTLNEDAPASGKEEKVEKEKTEKEKKKKTQESVADLMGQLRGLFEDDAVSPASILHADITASGNTALMDKMANVCDDYGISQEALEQQFEQQYGMTIQDFCQQSSGCVSEDDAVVDEGWMDDVAMDLGASDFDIKDPEDGIEVSVSGDELSDDGLPGGSFEMISDIDESDVEADSEHEGHSGKCQYCGSEIHPGSGNNLYCSPGCEQESELEEGKKVGNNEIQCIMVHMTRGDYSPRNHDAELVNGVYTEITGEQRVINVKKKLEKLPFITVDDEEGMLYFFYPKNKKLVMDMIQAQKSDSEVDESRDPEDQDTGHNGEPEQIESAPDTYAYLQKNPIKGNFRNIQARYGDNPYKIDEE